MHMNESCAYIVIYFNMLLDIVIAQTDQQAGPEAFFGFFGVTSALVFASKSEKERKGRLGSGLWDSEERHRDLERGDLQA